MDISVEIIYDCKRSASGADPRMISQGGYRTYSTYSDRQARVNRDLEQTPQNAASNQGLHHCLPHAQQFKGSIFLKIRHSII